MIHRCHMHCLRIHVSMIILEGHRTSLYRTACDYIPHWNPAIKKDGMAGRTQESCRALLISQYNKLSAMTTKANASNDGFQSFVFSWFFFVTFSCVIFCFSFFHQVAREVQRAIGAAVTPLPLAALSEEGWDSCNQQLRDRICPKPNRSRRK